MAWRSTGLLTGRPREAGRGDLTVFRVIARTTKTAGRGSARVRATPRFGPSAIHWVEKVGLQNRASTNMIAATKGVQSGSRWTPGGIAQLWAKLVKI